MKKTFVQTENVKNFIAAMKEAEEAVEDHVILLVYGQAGRGKTDTVDKISALEGWTKCRAMTGWSPRWMLQDLCKELKIDPIPRFTQYAYEAIKKELLESPRAVLIDEAHKLNNNLLQYIRDIADNTYAPFALVGETPLVKHMKNDRCMWRRTIRAVEFKENTTKDVMFFVKESTGISLSAKQAELLRVAANGDFGLVVRDTRRLENIMKSNSLDKASDEIIKEAIKQGFRGK